VKRSVNQILMVAAILKELHDQGFESHQKLLDGAVEAANVVVDAARSIDEVSDKKTMTVAEWLLGGDTGRSSEFMARVLSDMPADSFDGKNDYPRDPSDFGRCVRMLEKIPNLYRRLGRMRKHGLIWSALVDKWYSFRELYRSEAPSGKCPVLYREMRALFDSVEKATRSAEQTRRNAAEQSASPCKDGVDVDKSGAGCMGATGVG